MYKVRLEQFEGPLDLLLEIVEARKLNLIEIRLAEVAEQFIEYLKTLKAWRGEEIAEFLTIASRLALLKSRELVPTLNEAPEADGNLDELKRRLALYHPFRQAALRLKKLERERQEMYAREAFAGRHSIFFFPKGLTVLALARTLTDLTASLTLPHHIPQARMSTRVTLEECLDRLLARLKERKEIALHELDAPTPEHRILHFLSALELSRAGKVKATQRANFEPITLTYNG
jgi:segregation and condensation protein A